MREPFSPSFVYSVMYIDNIQSDPIHSFPYLNAGRRPNEFFVDQLPVFTATTTEMPSDLDAVVFCADLQGREVVSGNERRTPRLLGELIPQDLTPILESLNVHSPGRVAAILAGDFYTYPDLHARGGDGDITEVWQAFTDHYRWVAGVAGNHDTFGKHRKRPPNVRSSHYLDGDRANVDGLRMAGLGGVIGNPRKNFRRTESDYLETLEILLSDPTDLLILHEGPEGPKKNYRGWRTINEVIERGQPSLVVRGHKHWPEPLIDLPGGTQVLNVEATIVILTKSI